MHSSLKRNVSACVAGFAISASSGIAAAQWWGWDGTSHFDLTTPCDESWFAFDRGVATVDPQGNPVGDSTPRFRATRAVSGVWGDPELISSQLIGDGLADEVSILAAGRDRDFAGNPLLLVSSHGGRNLSVTTRRDGAFRTTSRTLLAIRSDSTAQAAVIDVGDIRTNLVNVGAGYAVDQVCYEPATGTVCFGTMVVLCRVHRYTPSTGWGISGFALFYSTDYGANFVKYYEDSATPANTRQFGKNRIASWSLQGWFCPYNDNRTGCDRHHCHDDHDDDTDYDNRPDEAVMTFTDYRFAPSDDNCSDPAVSDLPAGGRAGFFKLKQDRFGQYVPLQVGGIPAVGIFELNANSFLDPTHDTRTFCDGTPFHKAQVNYMHFHSMGVTEYSQGNPTARPWQMLLGVGDTVASSIVRIIVADSADDKYWKPQVGTRDNWTVQYNWHGTADSAMLNAAGHPTQRAGDSNEGFQFVGCAPGPERGTLLLGQDAIGESAMLARPSMSLSTDKTLSPILPSPGPNFGSGLMFQFRTDAPHLQLRTVSCDRRLSVGASSDLPPSLPGLDTLAFSRLAGAPGTWGELPLQPILPDRSDSYKDNAFVIGNFVYLVQADIYRAGGPPAYSQRVVRRKLPTVVSGMNLLQVGPGGTQLLRELPTRLFERGPGMRVGSASSTSPGAARHWNKVPLNGSAPGALAVQPPMVSGVLTRLARPRTLLPTANENQETQFGFIFPTNTGTGPLVSFFPTYAERNLTFRAWVLNSTGAPDSPQRNGPAPRSEAATSVQLNLSGQSVPVGSIVANDQWFCVVGSARVAVGGPSESHVEFLSVRPSQPRRENGVQNGVFDPQLLVDTDCYFGLSELLEGDQEIGYPLPSCHEHSGTVFPPERADVVLNRYQELSGNSDFTVYFAGNTPEDAWDTTPAQPGSSAEDLTQFPLLSLVTETDSDAWITLSASPRMLASSQPSLPHLAVDVGVRSRSGASGQLGPAAWIRGRSLVGVMVYDASDHRLRVSAALGGQRLPDLDLNVDLHNRTFKYIRLGDHHEGADRKVGAFQWAGVAVQDGAISSASVSRAMRTLYFLEPDTN